MGNIILNDDLHISSTKLQDSNDMDKKKQGKQRRKLKKLYAKEQSGDYAPGTTHESLVSWLANAARGNTYHERRKMIKFYKELEGLYHEKQLPQKPPDSEEGSENELT